ncbi:MAG TPA: MFS transporter [Solirubrobacteraceae bacterium]|nr:MFS transporter [Solirubrobacteraceae bacterium]
MKGRHRAAVTAVFAVNGASFASLFSRMPDLQRQHDLSDATLGLVLLAGALALMITQPLAGAAAARSGSAPLTVAGGLGYAGALALPGLASSAALFFGAMVVLGAASGVLDVSMNAQAVAVNKRHEREIFASFHAAFSFGALAGAGAGALAAGAGLSPLTHMTIVGLALVAIVLVVRPGLLPAEADARADGPAFARPSRALAALGTLAFCVLLAEGSVGDWSAILLDRETDAGPSLAALGLAAFSLTMGFGRLAADPLAERFGAPAVVRAGGLVAAAGLALALTATSAPIGISASRSWAAAWPGCSRWRSTPRRAARRRRHRRSPPSRRPATSASSRALPSSACCRIRRACRSRSCSPGCCASLPRCSLPRLPADAIRSRAMRPRHRRHRPRTDDAHRDRHDVRRHDRAGATRPHREDRAPRVARTCRCSSA